MEENNTFPLEEMSREELEAEIIILRQLAKKLRSDLLSAQTNWSNRHLDNYGYQGGA